MPWPKRPHSAQVIAYDPMTQSYTVTGPYPDAHVATLEAERIKAELNRAAGHPDYPPIQGRVTNISLSHLIDNKGCGQG